MQRDGVLLVAFVANADIARSKTKAGRKVLAIWFQAAGPTANCVTADSAVVLGLLSERVNNELTVAHLA